MADFLSQEDIDKLLDVVEEQEPTPEEEIIETHHGYSCERLIGDIIHKLLVANANGIIELLHHPSYYDTYWDDVVVLAIDGNEPDFINQAISNMHTQHEKALKEQGCSSEELSLLKKRFELYRKGIEAIQQGYSLSRAAILLESVL